MKKLYVLFFALVTCLAAFSQPFCTPVTSFTENFDSVTTPDLPACWTMAGGGGTINTINYDAYSGTNALFIYSGSTSDLAILYMPPVSNLADGTHRLKFRARGSFLAGGKIEVGYVTDTTIVSTFTTIETITVNSTVYESFVIIPPAIQDGQVLALRHTGDPAYGVLIDDVVWQRIPTCEAPGNIAVSNISDTAATIGWAAPAITNPLSYGVYFSTQNAPPDSNTAPQVSGVAGDMTTLGSLTPGTKYFVWVRSDCGDDGQSEYSDADSFTTACSVVTAFPWSENFNSVTTPGLPVCFSQIDKNTDNIGWHSYEYFGVNTTNAAGLETNSTAQNNDDYLVLPPFALTGQQRFRFSVRSLIDNLPNDYEVLLSTTGSDPDDFNTVLVPLTTAYNTTYKAVDWIDLSAYTGNVYIAIHVPAGGQFGYILLVDDLVVENIPTCIEPTALQVSDVTPFGAKLDWSLPLGSAATSYDVYYSTNAAEPADSTAAIDTSNSNTYLLTNLSAATTYYVWVRSNCGNGDVSHWTSSSQFTTLCDMVSSIAENFDNVTVPDLPQCWFTPFNNGDISTLPQIGVGGSNALYLYAASSGSPAVVSLPPVSNLADGTHRLKFSMSAGYFTGGVVEIGYLTDPADATSFTAVEDVTANSLFYQKFSVSPGVITGSSVLAFRHIGNPPNVVYIDDVSWEPIPGCDFPGGVTITGVTDSSARVSWIAPAAGSPASYELYISQDTATPVTGTVPSIAGVTDTVMNFDSLTGSTDYYVWVRSNCGAGMVSEWTAPGAFTTECSATMPPGIAETFDTGIPPGCWSETTGLLDRTTVLTGSTSFWNTGNFANDNNTANPSANIEIYGPVINEWLITNSYNLGTAGKFQMEFDMALNKYFSADSGVLGSDDKIAVLISKDNGATWSSANVLKTWSDSTPISNTGQHEVLDLSGYTGIVKFAFYAESTDYNEDNDLFIDNFAITVKTSLPVTMGDFKGVRAGLVNVLSWTTRTEQENKGFELQRSADGVHFSSLAFIGSGAEGGNSSSALHYAQTDAKPLYSGNFYRLKQINTDGSSALSNVVKIEGAKGNEMVLSGVYPNPAKDNLNIIIVSPATLRVELLVEDVVGKLVLKQNIQLQKGDNKITVPVGSFTPGLYMLKAFNPASMQQTEVSKFIKQ